MELFIGAHNAELAKCAPNRELETCVVAYMAGCGEGVAIVGGEVECYGFDEEVVVFLRLVVVENIEFGVFRG